MIIIRNNIIPFPGYKAINICGILFVRKDANITYADITHESIHTKQMLELLIVGFYLLYVLEWIVNIFRYPSAHIAYRNISFEKEAYLYEKYPNYLSSRKHYAQWRS